MGGGGGEGEGEGEGEGSKAGEVVGVLLGDGGGGGFVSLAQKNC